MKRTTMYSKRRQAGFSIMEAMIWAGLALLGFAAVVYFGFMGKAKMNSTNEARELPNIISGIQNSWNSQANFLNISLDAVARGGVWPANETTIPGAGAATVTNRFGGNVTLAAATITTANDIARLVYPNVPQTECNNIVNTVAGSLRRVYVDNTNSGTAGAGTLVKADGAALNIGTLATACGTSNSITYDIPH